MLLEPPTRILSWLDQQEQVVPEGIGRSQWEYAVGYARGRYEKGLAHYRRLFQELEWSGMRQGLDAGSGAGHWAIAFALDNECATGVDRDAAFVRIANGAAELAGLTGRVRHEVGNVEALAFPDGCFDAVWSHSTLQFCDPENAIAEFSRVLESGGRLYCGWSTTGLRLSGIHKRVVAGQRGALRGQIENYIAHVLHHDGVAFTHWSGAPLVTAAELAAICRAYGLRVLRQPGLQDEVPAFAGIPQTADLLCIRDGDTRAFRSELLELPLASEADHERHDELVRLGLGTLVYGVLRERGAATGDPDTRSLFVRAAMRAGSGADVAALAMAGIDPLVQGLLAFDRGRVTEAIAAFRCLPPHHRDRDFLLGAALLRSGATDEAVREFERGLSENRRPVECGIAAMLARLETADWPELRRRMLAILHLLPQEMGALPEALGPLEDVLLSAAG